MIPIKIGLKEEKEEEEDKKEETVVQEVKKEKEIIMGEEFIYKIKSKIISSLRLKISSFSDQRS